MQDFQEGEPRRSKRRRIKPTEWWNVRKTHQIHSKHLPMHPHPDIGYYNILYSEATIYCRKEIAYFDIYIQLYILCQI